MANEGYSILDVINDEYGVILTRNGCVSVAFRMYNPECYSLHRTDLEERNARLYQAFKHLPSGSFVHKQDVFLKREYVHELEGDSFIDKAEQRHFSGREYLEHDCLLIFTLSGLSSLAASYNANPFSYRERLHVSDREKLTEFLEGELRHWCDKQYQGHPSGKDGRRQPEGVCHPVHQLLPPG